MSLSRFPGSLERSRRNRVRKRLISGRRENLRVEALETRTLLAADLIGLSPTDDGSAGVGDHLVLTFSEAVQKGPGLGNIFIKNGADDTIIEVVNVNSDRMTFDGSTVTIDPVNDLPADASVYVTIDSGAIRDTSSDVTNQTLLSEDFESLPLKNSLLVPPFDDYVVTMTGILNVTVAGEYTFGINSDDGQELAIDVAQDGLDLVDDEMIFDDTTHGRQDRLSTCAFEDVDTLQNCAGQGDDGITLAVGEYAFLYLYFERGGGSGGEFFYAPGKHEAWDASAFALVGDGSKGIGLVDGVTATTYKSPAGEQVANLPTAEGLIEDDSLIIGTEKLELADVAENPGGRFSVNNQIPGATQWALDNDPNPNDWTEEGPYGWTRDNSNLIEGGAPEYNGWIFLDKEFWITQQGNQSRTDFELGEGTVLVADPDAHDDFIDNGGFNAASCLQVLTYGPECGLFTASVSTPPIYLNGVVENSATLKFDSSWWDEDTQSAETRVEYFDAAGNSLGTNVLLRWESVVESENYKPVTDPDTQVNARNEEVEVALENPANAASMIVTFDMPYATNDWWWSVDNIVVTADAAGNFFAGISDNTTWNFTTSEAGPSDVTAPGDELVRVDGQNDGDGNSGAPPAAEGVEHVIDNVTQKHLNFLDLGSGFIVTPSAGWSVVTGLRLYTANDAVPRDPASYKLEGGLPDGSFTLISEGDLSLPDARNAGGNIPIDTSLAHQEISFDNAGAYTSYRLTFPTLKDAAAANSMQIAEVEFLGNIVPAPPLPDVTSPGDALVRVDGQNDGDGNSGAPPAAEGVEHVIDNVTQKHLNFLDLGSGFIVTPSAGASVVSGLRLYTANDAVPRDPASYVLEGGLADGSFTLISEGDLALPDGRNPGGNIPIDSSLFFQEILFDNTVAYTSYRLTFPTLKDAAAANSMQIAEVEFLGSIVAPPTIPGDIDGDGTVAFADFLILSANFGQTVEPGTNGDIDGDGTVAFADFLVLSANFGKSAAPVAAAVDAALADLTSGGDDQ